MHDQIDSPAHDPSGGYEKPNPNHAALPIYWSRFARFESKPAAWNAVWRHREPRKLQHQPFDPSYSRLVNKCAFSVTDALRRSISNAASAAQSPAAPRVPPCKSDACRSGCDCGPLSGASGKHHGVAARHSSHWEVRGELRNMAGAFISRPSRFVNPTLPTPSPAARAIGGGALKWKHGGRR